MATYNLTDILDIVKLWGVDYPNKQKNRVKYDAFKKDLRKKIEETFDTEADALAAVTPELAAPVKPNPVTGQTTTYSARHIVWLFDQPLFLVWVIKHSARQEALLPLLKAEKTRSEVADTEENAEAIINNWH